MQIDLDIEVLRTLASATAAMTFRNENCAVDRSIDPDIRDRCAKAAAKQRAAYDALAALIYK